jgi:hypothetical protein
MKSKSFMPQRSEHERRDPDLSLDIVRENPPQMYMFRACVWSSSSPSGDMFLRFPLTTQWNLEPFQKIFWRNPESFRRSIEVENHNCFLWEEISHHIGNINE